MAEVRWYVDSKIKWNKKYNKNRENTHNQPHRAAISMFFLLLYTAPTELETRKQLSLSRRLLSAPTAVTTRPTIGQLKHQDQPYCWSKNWARPRSSANIQAAVQESLNKWWGPRNEKRPAQPNS